MRELRQQQEHMMVLLREMQSVRGNDGDLQFPVGIQVPLSSDDDIAGMESALEDDSFRKSLVIIGSKISPLFMCVSLSKCLT